MLGKRSTGSDGVQQRRVILPAVWTVIKTLIVMTFIGVELVTAVRADGWLSTSPFKKCQARWTENCSRVIEGQGTMATIAFVQQGTFMQEDLMTAMFAANCPNPEGI